MDHLSYSQYNSYTQCPRSWYLNKLRNAEPKQTWFILIGTAVHTAVEKHLKGEDHSLVDDFYDLTSKQMLVEPDTSTWLHGGSEDEPIVEERALKRALDCYENALIFLEDVEVWEIEYDASGRLPGLDIPLKAYVDILGEHKKHGLSIIDWKTGAQKPKNNFQLETYKALIAPNFKAYSVGLWAMLSPTASQARPIDLSQVDPVEVGAKYQAVYEKMQAKLYQTNAGYGCKWCFNQDNCLLQSGQTKRAKYYDKASEDGYPF